MIRPIIITSGEPAGIGPDICLELAGIDCPVVIMGSLDILSERALLLGKKINFRLYQPQQTIKKTKSTELWIYDIPHQTKVIPGTLDSRNSSYVIKMLDTAIASVLNQEFSAIVTAPVQKSIINQAGLAFTGHTEYLQHKCNTDYVVMLLASKKMKVALATTHIPLREVADTITTKLLIRTFEILAKACENDFGIPNPNIKVAGLNPHAGESGYLGREEIDVIKPAIDTFNHTNTNSHQSTVVGPFPADTLFTQEYLKSTDIFLTMYHDQGLSVIKYADFENAVNITLGLPIIRTSVDHGTALNLAGKGKVSSQSLKEAVILARDMVISRLAKCQKSISSPQ
jgi:4-hydroxythreonine-4-phosphate dehydrogenase